MLLLDSDVMAQQFDAQYRVAAESAAAKIESVLPETLRDEVRSLQESIRFFAPGDPAEQERLQTLRRAILDRRTARFRYTARWVREARSFFTVAEEETPDGLLVTLNVRDERDVLQWLLGWGSHVCVLEPESLRRVRFNPRHSATSSRCPRRMACR